VLLGVILPQRDSGPADPYIDVESRKLGSEFGLCLQLTAQMQVDIRIHVATESYSFQRVGHSGNGLVE